jgi:hypothetical protein
MTLCYGNNSHSNFIHIAGHRRMTRRSSKEDGFIFLMLFLDRAPTVTLRLWQSFWLQDVIIKRYAKILNHRFIGQGWKTRATQKMFRQTEKAYFRF